MIWKQLVSQQLRRPSGLIGRMLVAPYLGRANTRSNRLVFDSLDLEPGARVLEVGFGGGELLFRIADRVEPGRVDGVDLSVDMVDAAQRRTRRRGLEGRVRVHAASLENLPFDDAEFDRACSVHTVYFWADLHRGLAEFARVLKPGARLVLGFSSAAELENDGWIEHGFRAYPLDEIREAFAAQDFTDLQLQEIQREPQGQIYALAGTRS